MYQEKRKRSIRRIERIKRSTRKYIRKEEEVLEEEKEVQAKCI